MGGDFTYQEAGMYFKNLDKLIEYVNLKAAKDGRNIKLFYSTPDCYLKAVRDANPILPVKQDDFFPYASDSNSYWTGYLTSRPTTKYFEREGNNYLQMVKQLQVLAGLEEHNKFVLNELKAAMGIMQHHDAITGTEKQHVTHDYVRLLDRAIEDSLIIARQAFNKLMQGDALKPPILDFNRCRLNESSCYTTEHSEQFVVTVYNHLAWQVNESVRIPVVEGNYEVYAPNGDQITSQLVDIPQAVRNLPSRKSIATHEIIFIAHLHPLSYKSFYVKRQRNLVKRQLLETKNKHKNEFYNDINDYWKKMNEKSFIDIKAIEENIGGFNNVYKNKAANKDKIPDEPFYMRHGNDNHVRESADINVDVLKDSNNDSPHAKELEKIIKESQRLLAETKQKASRSRAAGYPKMMDDDVLRMLSDDPQVVEYFPETIHLENKHVELHVNGTIGQIIGATLPDATGPKLSIKFFYYPGRVGNNEVAQNRSSGAYIFRPNVTDPVELITSYVAGPKGSVVQEIRTETNDTIFSAVRIYDGLNFIENDWIAGPIDVSDKIGKEFVVRYITDIVNNGEFYTDSNGRQMLKRKLGHRPQYNLTLAEPVAGNYYPVTNKITIEDDKAKLAVFTDRSEGGSSLAEGNIELMLHRRLLKDDAFGVGEALNEVEYGKGLIVRGRHRIYISKPDDKDSHIEEKKQVIQFHLQPQIFLSKAENLALDDWMKLKNCYSWADPFPEGVHLLTLEPWAGNTMLLRLENYLEVSDRTDSSIEVDLQSILKTIRVKSFREATLSANQWKSEVNKWSWSTRNDFVKNFNEAYGISNAPKSQNEEARSNDRGSKIVLKAKEIRTFVVDYELI